MLSRRNVCGAKFCAREFRWRKSGSRPSPRADGANSSRPAIKLPDGESGTNLTSPWQECKAGNGLRKMTDGRLVVVRQVLKRLAFQTWNCFDNVQLDLLMPNATSRNQKDNLQLIEKPSGSCFISWVFLSVGKGLCFFCKDLICNGPTTHFCQPQLVREKEESESEECLQLRSLDQERGSGLLQREIVAAQAKWYFQLRETNQPIRFSSIGWVVSICWRFSLSRRLRCYGESFLTQ